MTAPVGYGRSGKGNPMASNSSSVTRIDATIHPGSVKICGTRTVEHALVAVDAGAELIGMIFAPARRQVAIEMARRISDAVHATSSEVRVVGVFVDAPADEINASARDAGLDLVQLHGDEPRELIADLEFPAIKVFRPPPGERAGDLTNRIRPYLAAAVPPVAILIDGYDPKAHGGTGARADWDIVRAVSDELGNVVGLAGGLTPGNVGGAIQTVTPLLVDTSSGVEIDGVKDASLIRAFIAGADRAFAETAAAAPSS